MFISSFKKGGWLKSVVTVYNSYKVYKPEQFDKYKYEVRINVFIKILKQKY